MDGIEYGKSVHANSNEIAGIAAMITSLANAFGRTGQAGLSEELYEHADNLIKVSEDISNNFGKHVNHEFEKSNEQVTITLRTALEASMIKGK